MNQNQTNLKYVDKIYLCHYTKLIERVALVKNQLDKYKISPQWILEYDKEDLDKDELIKILPHFDKEMSLFGGSRKLRQSEISLLMKHYFAWCDMVEKNIENAIIFEDDIILCDNFLERFNIQIENIDNDYDIIWIGSCCNLHADFKGTHLIPHKGSRCTHAYMISNKCAKKAIDNFRINNYPADFYFNFLIEKLDLKNYWMEPDLVSQNPKFESSVQTKE